MPSAALQEVCRNDCHTGSLAIPPECETLEISCQGDYQETGKLAGYRPGLQSRG